MGVLDNQLEIEQLPLGQLGVWVQNITEHGTAADILIDAIQEHINTDCGLSYSTQSIYDIIKREYPEAIGMDMYRLGAGISLSGKCYTLPPHWFCRVFPADFQFMLFAPNIKSNCTNVSIRGTTNYMNVNYAKKFKDIKRSTLIDLTGNEDSLSTIGSFVRGARRWQPVSFENINVFGY